MKDFHVRLKKSREDKKEENSIWTQAYVAEKIGVARSTYTAYENGTKLPPLDTVDKIADVLGVSVDYLRGKTNKKDNPNLLEKDERDIAKRLQKFKEEIESTDGLAFSGEPLSKEAKESLIESMEHIFRQTQRINKKYIPKKYRNEEKE